MVGAFLLVFVVSGCAKKAVQTPEDREITKSQESINIQELVNPEKSSVVNSSELVATSTDVENNITKYEDKEKGFSINFVDGYEKYNDNQIAFGPLVSSLYPNANQKLVRAYQLDIVEHKSVSDLVNNYKIIGVTTVKPVVERIGDFEVVKYAEGGMCEERIMELVDEKFSKQYNYRFSSDGCHKDQKTDFDYLEKTIKQLDLSGDNNIVKISQLKPGDTYGSLVVIGSLNVKSITGDWCESNCQREFGGEIFFEGEVVIVGKIWFDPDYPISVWFEPSQGYSLPTATFKKDEFAIDGVINARDSFSFSNKDIIHGDYSLISQKLPDFSDFVRKAERRPYDKEVLIVIRNYRISVATGGESGNFADLVEIIRVLD